ncbi:MAG: xanthan lyase [Alistipes sp.]|nr:xanthan lyase [Alistipes sp.]
MKKRRLFIGLTLMALCGGLESLHAQQLSDSTRNEIGTFLTQTARTMLRSGQITIDSVADSKRQLELYAGENCAYIPFREENVRAIYDGIRQRLPEAYARKKIILYTDGSAIEELIPNPLRTKADPKLKRFTTVATRPLVTPLDRPYTPEAGLAGRHIAMWQSHGYYFEAKLNRWEWQRARIFETVEDLYTQSYVLPYLIPMLERAGAYVLLPRERDTQRAEVIIDNDPSVQSGSRYEEINGNRKWSEGLQPGFAYTRHLYKEKENPFREGTYRRVESVTRESEQSVAQWTPQIPTEGAYAVYISYHSEPQSSDDVLYTVHHLGGITRFHINQTMGGGTWIYLGHFRFGEGCTAEGSITVSNLSRKKGRIITADGVKVGGGEGNIARITPPAQQQPEMPYTYEASGYPRFTEAARYWLQWAGVPDSVYSSTQFTSDYKDDYLSRGLWVNYLVGGSANAPKRKGLHIPIDLSLAFHTDAGTTPDDSIIGTLGIYYTHKTEGRYPNGTSRMLSRDLTDMIQTQIVADLQAQFEPRWSRRGMWNDSYFEAHLPEVPSMLLELLSHQNFADMRYGLDPSFRFTVCRAIYKAMARFIAFQHKQECVIQPLPVDHFRIQEQDKNRVQLSWQPVADTLEPTATAERYLLYTRVGDGDFDHGVIVEGTSVSIEQEPGRLYSYRVTALNRGGESFPSETLSACLVARSKGTVLVINGFDRISAPYSFVDDSLAGFYDEVDHGVPDGTDIAYIGSQYEFGRPTPYADDDAAGFGASRADYETQVIAGNSRDYPSVHGRALVAAGYSFVSSSDEAVGAERGTLKDYKAIDLILGKQRTTAVARGAKPARFATYPAPLRQQLTDYCQAGGSLLVSGAYLLSDLHQQDTAAARTFGAEVLKIKLRTARAAIRGEVKSVSSPFPSLNGRYTYHHALSDSCYVVESPDAIEPADPKAYTVFRYSENNLSAGVAYKGAYRVCALGFPIEALQTEEQRRAMIQTIFTFFETK